MIKKGMGNLGKRGVAQKASAFGIQTRSWLSAAVIMGFVPPKLGLPCYIYAETERKNFTIHRELAGSSVLEIAIGQMLLQVVVHLKLAVTVFRVRLNVAVKFGLFVGDEDLGDAMDALGEQLDLTAALHAGEEEGGLVDGVADGQQTVVTQDGALAAGAEGGGDAVALFGAEHNTTVGIVDGLGVAVELAGILRDHVEAAAKDGPGLAVDAVGVADGVDIGSGLVDGRMDEKAGLVRGSCAVTPDNGAVEIDENHVGGLEEAEVDAEWVGPEGRGIFWVAYRYVAAEALDVVGTRPVAEGGG